jgi:hypothetical protein
MEISMRVLEMVIEAIIGIGVSSTWDAIKHRETVIRLLNRFKLDPNNPPTSFEGIYAHSLVEYGVFKPEPILNFFRYPFVQEAFKRSFYKNDPSILEREAEGIIQWNEEIGKLGRIDYDPRREFAAFTMVFNHLVNYSRTPAEVRNEQKLDKVLEQLDQIHNQDLTVLRKEVQQLTVQIIDIENKGENIFSFKQEDIELLRQKYIEWLAKTNEYFYIPSLNIKIPISEAWIKLRAIVAKDDNGGNKSLQDELKDYHEWHRLSYSKGTDSNLTDIEIATKKPRNIVVIGGPGSGKSTLLRRLARNWSLDGKLVLRVSLQAVALRMNNGETFDEAIIAVASDGYGGLSADLSTLLRRSSCLLADGLDETDPNRAHIVELLKNWASAKDDRQVILTTRPVGHNPAWLDSWNHYELLPLQQDDIDNFSNLIFPLIPHQLENAGKLADVFIADLGQSRTASIAARNPQLLGFIIALYIRNQSISGNRFQLFENIVELIRSQTVPDRNYQHVADKPTAQRVLEHLGWFLVDRGTCHEDELMRILGKCISEELSITSLQGEKIVHETLLFWEERGLLEKISAGTESTFTFIHTGLQEFAATQFVLRLSKHGFISLVKSKYLDPKFREPLLLLGGTEFLDLTINTLLELDEPSDPISTAGFLAVDVLAETDNPSSDLLQKLFENLRERLNSNVPLVVNEAGQKLLVIARFNPDLIGSIALKLQTEEEIWMQKIGLALGLSSNEKYVEIEKLKNIFMTETTSVYGGYEPYRIDSNPLENIIILKGAEFLLKHDPSEATINAIKEKYNEGKHSMHTIESLLETLHEYIDHKEYVALSRRWIPENLMENIQQGAENHRKALAGFLNAVIIACNSFQDMMVTTHRYYENSISILYKAFDIHESPARDVMYFIHQKYQIACIEVLRAAILATKLNPNEVKNDTEHILFSLKNDDFHWYDTFKESDEEIKFNWDVINSENTNVLKLIQAMHHPSSFVVRFATLLLVNSYDPILIGNYLKEVLATGKNYTLYFISKIADEIWQEDAIDLVLTRLENNLTEDCAPLIERLEDLYNEKYKERIIVILRNALDLEEVEIVEAAVGCVDKLELDMELGNFIKERYNWWLSEGPQDPEKGGVVPENAADTLLSFLIARDRMSFDDLLIAVKSKRRDVREVATSGLCNSLAENDEQIADVFDNISHDELPSSILKELASSHPNVCRKHQNLFVQLLDVDNVGVQKTCIQALSLQWMDALAVDEILRSRIDDSELIIRNEIVKTLRILRDTT